MTNNFPIVNGQVEVVVEETGEDSNHWLLGGNCEYGCQYRRKNKSGVFLFSLCNLCLHAHIFRMHTYIYALTQKHAPVNI